jgi:hypothetical protein
VCIFFYLLLHVSFPTYICFLRSFFLFFFVGVLVSGYICFLLSYFFLFLFISPPSLFVLEHSREPLNPAVGAPRTIRENSKTALQNPMEFDSGQQYYDLGSSTSQNPLGLHGLSQGYLCSFTIYNSFSFVTCERNAPSHIISHMNWQQWERNKNTCIIFYVRDFPHHFSERIFFRVWDSERCGYDMEYNVIHSRWKSTSVSE